MDTQLWFVSICLSPLIIVVLVMIYAACEWRPKTPCELRRKRIYKNRIRRIDQSVSVLISTNMRNRHGLAFH
jgi:hypothetical protein